MGGRRDCPRNTRHRSKSHAAEPHHGSAVAIGRRNWLFAGSERAASTVAGEVVSNPPMSRVGFVAVRGQLCRRAHRDKVGLGSFSQVKNLTWAHEEVVVSRIGR